MADKKRRGPQQSKPPKIDSNSKRKRGKRPVDDLNELKEHLPSVPSPPSGGLRRKMLQAAKKAVEAPTPRDGARTPGGEPVGKGPVSMSKVMADISASFKDELMQFGYNDIVYAMDRMLQSAEEIYGETFVQEAVASVEPPWIEFWEYLYFPSQVMAKCTRYITQIMNKIDKWHSPYEKTMEKSDFEAFDAARNEWIADTSDELTFLQEAYAEEERTGNVQSHSEAAYNWNETHEENPYELRRGRK